MFRTLVLPLVAVAVVLPACSSSSKSSSAPAAPSGSGAAPAAGGAAGTAITIKSFAFGPASLKAKAGATIQVMNADGTAHTLTADDKSFDTGRLEAGASKPITAPTKPGNYAYHCNIHDYMKGMLTVA